MKEIFVFHVHLAEITPLIWRRLEIRAEGTFWHLHCAIQDALPWEDRHLHEFRFPAGDAETLIGFPDVDEFEEDRMILASWETPLKDWFVAVPSRCLYVYDFGDEWIHTVTLESRRPAERGGRYPRCTAGERRCPPEDVGGPHGYSQFLEAMSTPRHSEHRSWKRWVGGPWDPERFRPEAVLFSRPGVRLRQAGLA
jgi:Plasmid pRiA4b ORF-3-like protein